MIKKIISIVLMTCLFSCSIAQNNIDNDIKLCIEYKIQTFQEQIDLYNYYIEIEDILIQNKLLNNNKKESYIKLLDKLIEDEDLEFKKLFQQINKKLEKHYILNFPSVYKASIRCNWYVIEKNNLQEDIYYKGYYSALVDFDRSDKLNDWLINKNLFESTPKKGFNSIIYRAPLIAFLHNYIEFRSR